MMNWYKIAQTEITENELSEKLQQLVQNLKSQHEGLDLIVWFGNNYIEIAKIEVPLERRHQGIGYRVIKEIKNFAREAGVPVVLRPEAERGYKKKLDRFYRDLGFVHNKGRNTDYQLSSPFAPTMYWKP